MSVFCVNRSHEDFKKLSKELDIHEDQLDDIIFKYKNDNQVDALPSKEYIENLLRGDNPVTSLDQYGIWLNKYSEPKVFDSKEEANSYIEEAKRFFPVKGAIVTKRKVNGQIEVTIGRPYDKNDITSLLMHHLNTYEGIEVGNSTELGNYLQKNGLSNILEAIEEEKEMLAIKAKAIADGTFMKAPNGKKSNLNERQWLQVRTKNFINWFGDWINDPANASKVVDENGEPLVVYHGGKYKKGEKFSVFDVSKSENRFWLSTVIGNKSFFTNNHYLAYKMSQPDYYQREVENLEGSVYAVFLNLKNPLVLNAEGRRADFFIDEHKQELKDNEEIIVNNIDEDGINVTDYVVSNPNQIKSATDNNGMFSTENNDIQMFIGKKARTKFAAKEHGVTIQTEALNITGNKFKNSLYRGQGYAPVIDAEGNLHLHTNYDSLSKLRTLSFDSTIEGAEHYGNRSARHPYIIEIDEDFLDTILPKEDYDRDKVNRGESFRYNEEFNEVRLSFKDELIIPKGKFNITQTNETLRLEDFDDIMSSIGWLQSLEKRSEIEEYNGASELTGRIHENDLKSLGKALKNTLGTYKGYDVITILYDVLALQNDVPGSPIGPSNQYKEFINKGLIETEDLNGYTYYRPSKALIEHLTKKLGLRKTSKTSQSIFPQSPSTPSTPPTPFAHFAPSNDYGDLPFFRTPQGEIYGFVGKDNKIYLDERIISPEHPIHEYTHLWDRVVAKINPKLWKRGIELMKKTSLWELYANDPNYGLKWKATEGMTAERFEELVASEVHARLVGKEGEALLTQLAKEKGSKNIIEKLKSWLLDVWRELKSTFSNWSLEDINKLTLEDFNNMTLRDFVNKVSLDTNSLLRSLNEEYYAEREDFNKQLGEENTRTDTEKALNNWFEWGKEHIKFDEDSHIYYIDGKPVDYSVTEYYESVYGKPKIKGDYSHSLAIGKTMDSFYRDYFKGEDVLSKDYPNLNQQRKKEALVDVRRLESYLDKEFHVDASGKKKYKIITTEFPLAARINTPIGELTIAGTMDMLVIDDEGNLHIFDFKAKTNTIDEWNNRRNYTAQLNLYRAILESIDPAFKGKVKSLSLIWLNTYYPGIRNANYTTFKNGSVIVSDGTYNNVPLSEYKHFMTPRLSEEEKKALIKLDIKDDIQGVKPSSVRPLILKLQQNNIPSFYEGSITPDANTIFVFGSNPKGIHGAGAAYTAKTQFGAIQGQGEGMQGNAYALPTKDLDKAKGTRWYRPGKKEETEVKEWYKNHNYSEVQNHPLNTERTMTPLQIIESIKKLYEAASQNPDKLFKVSYYPFGQLSLNGYLGEEMLAMFKQAGPIPSNIIFNKIWTDNWNEVQSTQQQPTQQQNKIQSSTIDTNTISNKTAAYNVEVSINSEDFWKKVNNGWQEQHPKGIVAYRKHGGSIDTFSQKTVEEGWIGNPFSVANRDEITVQQFYDWLVSGKIPTDADKTTKDRANEEFRQAIIRKILSTPTNSPVLYYTELNRPSHATVIGYLINNKQLLQDLVKPIQTLQELRVQATETLKTTKEQIKPKQAQTETTSNQTLSKEAQKHINRCLVYKKQVEELSKSFKKSEIQTLSTSIANRVSSIISEIEENPNLIKDYFNLERSELSETPTREEIINKIGIDNLYKAIANKYFGNVLGFLKKGKAIKIQRNFQILMLLSNPILSKNEGIQVDFNFTKKDVEEILASFDENEEANENNATSQESWLNNIRTVSVENMMLPKIRRLLSNLPLIKNGELIKDEWGIPQTVSLREAIGTILNAIGGKAKDHKQMASLLTLYIEDSKNTWLQPIVDILNDTTGKYETELSLLFKDFCKNSLKFSVSGDSFVSHVIDSKLDYAFSRVKQTFGSKLWLILNKTDNKVNKEGLNKLSELATVNTLKTKEGIKQLYEAFGIYLSNLDAERIVSLGREESLVTTIRSIYTVLLKVNEEFTPFDRNSDSGISSYLHTLLEPYVKITSEGFTSTVVSEGKRYQLFVLPSFLSKFNSIILNSSEEDLVNWMMNTYGNVEWYKLSDTNYEDVLDSVADGWRNPILLLLATDPNFRKNFDWTQSLGYREEKLYQFMRTMSPLQCFKMQLNMFNATDGRKGDIIPAWYAVPLMANKPSAEFIKLNRYRGDNYKATILGLLAPMFIKEVYRIKLVRERKNYIKEHPEKEIQNFDKRGDKFCNFEMFNDVSESSKKIIEDFIEGKTSVEELSNMFNSEMTKYLDSRVVTNSMLLNILDTALENFYWNNFLAKMSMEDLFLGDSAFYKNVVDKVKRALLLHSSGQRPNTSATWNKKLVSDGKHRAIVLSSFKEIKSNIISNLKEVFAKRAALFTGEDRNAFEAYADSIIKLYEEVDVTDGQAYTTISGYRKKAIMFGKWSREAEEVYNKLKNGEVNLSVLKQAFPPLKPFQYSQTKTDLSNNGQIVSNVSSTLVPSQYKTAEYLLIMADALLLGNKENNNNILKAITDIIEDTHNGEGDDYKKGIDTVLFDSSVKEGNSAVIDISTLIKEGKTAKDIKNEIKDKISRYKQDSSNPYVKVTPFEDYMILQELPPHFKDHYQSFPTLARYLAITDLLSNFNGEEVLFTIGDKSYTVKELQQEWEKVWKEEVDYGTDKLLKELAINSGNKAERNVRLSKLLVNSLLDSSKMNMETFESILVDENGEFQMPIDDPALATTVMPLIFSAVKSRVNKQTAAGGPIVQVSSFGTSKKLNIRFKDKSGKLLLTREGWENSKNKSHESYDDYIKENQAGVAYMEVYASVPSEEIFNTFRDKKGNIDIKAINRVNPGLLEMIGVRIPTEGKLSMWPMKIVGFLPYEAGEAIMLPEEITKITGSDFDSDKQYVIRKALSIVERTADNKKEKVINYLLEQNKNYTREFVEKAYDEYMENPENYKDSEDVHWEVENALSKSHIKYAARATEEHNKRRNHIFDMMMAVLLHESVADQLLTPQGFDLLKTLAAEINGVSDFSELQNDPTNLTDLATYLNYYNLNKEGGQMLGIFASQKLAHAVLSMDNYHLLISGLEKTPFKLGGLVYKGLIAIDPLYNKEGTLIGEILGSCVGASADVTKDPVLPYLGINSYNINVFITGVRLGIPLKPLVLLLNHPALKALYAEKNNGETKSLKSLVSQALNTKLEKAGFEKEGRNSEMFMSKDALETDLTALNAFLTLIYCSETVDALSKKTRLNSTTDSATVGPYFGDFLYKDKVLSNQVPGIFDEEGNFVDANDTFYKNHPMLDALYNAFPIIKKIFKDTSLGNLLNVILEEGLRTTGVEILKNQGLATKFIKFYQSLLLFYLNQSDPNKGISIKKVADGYYDTFAKNFNKIKESYKDNQLIKTIKIEIDNKGEATLLIPNLDDLGREEVNALRAAWEDLAVDAPEVARDLFEWNAVKGGLTFNPNTFVHLAGNNVRSLIPGYKEAFAGNADFNISRIYDDFIVKYWRQLMLPRLTPKIIAEKSYKYVTDVEYLYKLNDSGEYRVVNTNIPVYQQLSELMDENKSESQEGMDYQNDIYRLEDREITDNALALDALKKSDETDTDDYLKLNEEAGLHIPLTKEEKNNIIEDLKGYCPVNKKP